MRKLLLYVAIFGFVLSACKKTSLPNRPVDADLKAAFSYLPGTYWIYRDSISGQVDSFFVRSIGYNNYSYNAQYTFDEITCWITEWNTDSIADSNNWLIQLDQNSFEISYDLGAIYSYGYSYSPITYPFVTGEYVGISNNNLNTLNMINSYSINTNSFTNVAVVHYVTDPDDYFYLNSDVGIIEIIFNQAGGPPRVWELQRWNIVK